MNDKLEENSESPKLERLADPEWKEEYEMPAWYQDRLKQFVELLEARDSYKKSLSSLPPDDYAIALPAFQELDRAVESLEQKLADEYENFQEEQRRDQELYELTWLQEGISEELFIWVKHKKPYIFDKFVEYATDGMTAEELAEHSVIVAKREAEELTDILASRTPPESAYENLFLKHLLPDEWMPEQLLHIIYQAYETDDFFKKNLETLERGIDTKRGFIFHLNDALPVRRRNMEDESVALKKRLSEGSRFLLDYAENCRKSGKFVLLENPDGEKLDELFDWLEGNRVRKYVILKHTKPETLDEYLRIVTEDFTPEETADFLRYAAETDEKDWPTLEESLEFEQLSIEIVEARRAAGEKKINGPELGKISKRQMKSNKYLKPLTPKTGGKPDYDIAQRYDRNLRAFYAVTGGDYISERFEDEKSRADEDLEMTLEETLGHIEEMYFMIKTEKPELFAEFEKTISASMAPEVLEEFYARIAEHEAEIKKTKD
jgi:hypothetical protein